MPSWKKVLVSGSSAHLNHITASGNSTFGGNVGIGTTSPNNLLSISAGTGNKGIGVYATGGSDATLVLAENSDDFASAPSSGFRLMYDGGDNNFYIQSGDDTTVNTRLSIERNSGKVGIGTTTPNSKLHVVGDIRATGDIIAQNYIVSSSVTYMTSSFSSGSTIFGDSLDDTHQFTGSVYISGSGDGLTITSPSSDYGIRFKTPTANKGRIGSDAAIILFNESAMTLTAGSLAGTALSKISVALLPISDATYNLGSGAYRWSPRCCLYL